MSDRPTPETDAIVRNAATADHTMTRLAATLTVKCEKLERERDEAREIARELQDALTEVMRVATPYMKRIGDTHVIRFVDATIQKSKEVLP